MILTCRCKDLFSFIIAVENISHTFVQSIIVLAFSDQVLEFQYKLSKLLYLVFLLVELLF